MLSRCDRGLCLAALLIVVAVTLGCSGTRRRDCFARVWLPADKAAGATVIGSWNGWALPGEPLAETSGDPAWRLARLSLPPGEQAYLVRYGDGTTHIDAYNALTTFIVGADGEDQEVSLLLVPDCSLPKVAPKQVDAKADGTVTVWATFLAAEDGEKLDPDSVAAASDSGWSFEVLEADEDSGAIVVQAKGLPVGKHDISITAADGDGLTAEPGLALARVAPLAPTWQDDVLYQIMIDRFRGDGGVALAKPATPGSRAGGTLDGVAAELERGTFAELGVTALWLSPVYVNPAEPQLGNDGKHYYEGYHGYWPAESRAVDPRIGGEQALERVVSLAHARGMKVLLDVVPNHVYAEHPLYLEHGDSAAWFNLDGCVCGVDDCPWSASCWFTPYLPDLHLQYPEAMRFVVADTLFWIDRFDLDGVRIDAVPMMPRAATRRIAHELRRRSFPSDGLMSLGEVFTGGGAGGLGALSYFMGPGLDSAFDFPLMWALRNTVSHAKSFAEVEEILQLEEEKMASAGVLARILDNHDTARFISEANGDKLSKPWDNPPEQPASEDPYKRLQLGLAVAFTVEGIPVIFQGDEIGLAGANDPDNRRVMPAEDELSAEQQAVLETTRRLGQLRHCSTVLRHGRRSKLHVSADRYAYGRGLDGDWPVITLLTTSPVETAITLAAEEIPEGLYADAFTGEVLEATAGGLSVPLGPLSFRLLMRQEDPCL